MRGRPLLAVFLCMIAFLALLRILGLPGPGERVWDEKTLSLISESESLCVFGTVTEKNESDDGISYLISDTVLYLQGQNIQTGSIMLYFKNIEPDLSIDSKVRAYGKLAKYEHASNDGGFDAYEYYSADDRYFRMTCTRAETVSSPSFSVRRVLAKLRSKMKEVLFRGAGQKGGAVLSAMMLGDRSSVTDESELNFSSAGLSHLLAISGLHVSLIGMGILAFLRKLYFSKYAACAVSVSFLLFYTLFTGARESTVRALVMFAVMAIGKCVLRSYDSVSSLSVAGIIILILRPSSLFRAGFQFSFAAAFGAAVICPLLIKKMNINVYKKGKIPGILLSSVFVWLAVHAATVPVMLWHYYEFPVLSIFTNMVFVPLMSMVMLLGFAGVLVGLLFPGAARLLLFLPSVLTQAMEASGEFLRRFPLYSFVTGRPAPFQIGIYVLGVAVLLMAVSRKKKIRKSLLAAAFASFFFVFINLRSGFSISMLDIGQGECIVIKTDDECFIMDSGSTSKEEVASTILLPFLKYHGITEVEAVFVSHDDLDHTSGITELFGMIEKNETRVRVKRLVLPYVMQAYAYAGDEKAEEMILSGSRCEEGVTYVKARDTIRSGDLVFDVIAPGRDETDGNSGAGGDAGIGEDNGAGGDAGIGEDNRAGGDAGIEEDNRAGGDVRFDDKNDNSLVLAVSYKGFTALLTGDIEEEAEKEILPYLEASLDHCDVLKVAHHGSSSSSTEEFLDTVRPSAALISCGRNNIYGHPHKETLEHLSEAGADIYTTAQRGEIDVSVSTSGKNSFRISTKK